MNTELANDRGLKQAITKMDETACQFSTGTYERCQSTIIRLSLKADKPIALNLRHYTYHETFESVEVAVFNDDYYSCLDKWLTSVFRSFQKQAWN